MKLGPREGFTVEGIGGGSEVEVVGVTTADLVGLPVLACFGGGDVDHGEGGEGVGSCVVHDPSSATTKGGGHWRGVH